MVAGNTGTVVWDERDRYGRIVGWVIDPEGTWFNVVVVLTGLAWWYERYAPGEGQLRDAQETARVAEAGVMGSGRSN